MKDYLLLMGLSLILVGTQLFIYNKGMSDGVARYKRSQEFAYTLKSAYHFGYMDCRSGDMETWNGE